MICPHIVNVSMMLGSILTWGILWPFIDGKAGEWYPLGLKEHDFKGLFGYKVSVSPGRPGWPAEVQSASSCRGFAHPDIHVTEHASQPSTAAELAEIHDSRPIEAGMATE